ncbi:transcriptional regulator with XRE-family HTH domain [Nocardia transvalensis]|uniref:Transcriptional regulator with XRE-family HTH domain n=1 Tax=Nocardia transvalensis TaxID=37333 RepID=A0A7W9UMA0_9NOCA|nr:helix-turn-helix domain-containing protein [Nocardia transvalensis]MBB5918152.1 transcriptional regulator with XRE-family HTH domain [Nocardia transvalensis]
MDALDDAAGVTALLMTTGGTIRRIRKSLGMTQGELGALIHFTQPGVSQLEHDGPAVHDIRVLRRVAKALQVPLAILVVDTNEEADVERRQFFKIGVLGVGAAAATGKSTIANESVPAATKVGGADVERITTSVDKFHELQLMTGGDSLCEIATNNVRYIEHLLDDGSYSDKVGRALTNAGAEMMTAAGWIHYDAGRWNEARRYYADAAQAATVTGNGIAAAHAWVNACLLSYREGSRPKEGVQLAEAAQLAARREGGPKLRALAAIREAEAYSVIGDQSATVAAINRAHRAFESTKGRDPSCLAYLPEAQLSGLTGLAFMRLGDHDKATTHLRTAVEGTPMYPRERTAWQIRLAQNHIRAGAIADGCALLVQHFENVGKVASARLQTALTNIAGELRTHTSVTEVREFFGLWTTR